MVVNVRVDPSKATVQTHRSEIEGEWHRSVGEAFWRVHYREPSPGTLHAERDIGSDWFDIHSDRVNAHADPVGHLLKDSPQTIAGVGSAAAVGIVTRSGRKAALAGVLAYGVVKGYRWAMGL